MVVLLAHITARERYSIRCSSEKCVLCRGGRMGGGGERGTQQLPANTVGEHEAWAISRAFSGVCACRRGRLFVVLPHCMASHSFMHGTLPISCSVTSRRLFGT